jgi:hypothetical protein
MPYILFSREYLTTYNEIYFIDCVVNYVISFNSLKSSGDYMYHLL